MSALVETAAVGSHRRLGGVTIVGGAAYLAAGIILIAKGDGDLAAVNLLSLVWAVGAICGLTGIGLLNVVGRGLFARISLAASVVAYALAALDAVFVLAGAYGPEESPIFAVSRLGTLVGMMVVGIAAVAVGTWHGWRRCSPFALLMALPMTVLLGLVMDEASPVPGIGMAWILIGFAIVTTPATA